MLFRIIQRNIVILLSQGAKRRAPPHLRPISFNFMHFLPKNRMCAPPFATKQRPPIWKILDPPLLREGFAWGCLAAAHYGIPGSLVLGFDLKLRKLGNVVANM